MLKTKRNEQIAYLAGIIDGEGSIGLYRRSVKSFRPSLKVEMNDLGAIEYIQNNFGGRVYQSDQESRTNKSYVLRFDTLKDIKHILTICKDKLKIKKPQAEAVLQYLEVKDSDMENKHLHYFNLEKRCKALKKKGWEKTTQES